MGVALLSENYTSTVLRGECKLWCKREKNKVDQQVPCLPREEGVWQVGFPGWQVTQLTAELTSTSSLRRGSSSLGVINQR